MSNSSRVIAGLLFFLGAAQFATVVMLAEALVPGYNLHDAAISDLGVFDASKFLFNASLITLGVFIILAAYLNNRVQNKRWLMIIFILAGAGAMLAGIFNLEWGFHGLFALIAFIFVNAQTIAASTIVRNPLKILSIILGAIGFIALGFHIAGDIFGVTAAYGPIGHGGSERMIVYPGLLWLMAFGGYLMASREHGTNSRANLR